MRFPLVGNERVKSSVGNMLVSIKLPHAILIEGEEGLGKTTLARFLSAAILCENEESPCGKCAACRLFNGGNHPDITFVKPERDRKSISVDQVREIVSNAAIVPQMSARRIFLIDDAENMTVQAQNALLKVLEEPEETVVFILTARSKSALLETVVSRCSVLTLTPVDEQIATEYISSVSKKEPADISAAYKSARGNIGAALNILKHKSASAAEEKAKQFAEIMQNGSEYDLLKLLLPLEKSRPKTLDFMNALEVLLVSLIRESKSKTLVGRYEKLYNKVLDGKTLLKSNTNLSLLLTSLVMAAMTER